MYTLITHPVFYYAVSLVTIAFFVYYIKGVKKKVYERQEQYYSKCRELQQITEELKQQKNAYQLYERIYQQLEEITSAQISDNRFCLIYDEKINEDIPLLITIRKNNSIHMNCHILGKEKTIHIGGLTVLTEEKAKRINYFIGNISLNKPYRGKGIGSRLLQLLLTIAATENVYKIYGRISYVDWGKVEKVQNFYHKNGFDVQLDYSNKEGHLCKYLTKKEQPTDCSFLSAPGK